MGRGLPHRIPGMLRIPWPLLALAGGSFSLGAWLYLKLGATYEGYELMTAMTVVILTWPAFHSLFTWRMALLSLAIIAPISLVFQCLAVKYGIWVYGSGPFWLGRMDTWGLGMPWMEVVFYFLFPMFQLGLFAFFIRRFPPRPLPSPWSGLLILIPLGAPFAFAAQGVFRILNPWQAEARPFDWNCAIMGTALGVVLVAFAMSEPYRLFVRSRFFAAWTLGMGAYMLLWEQFHTVFHDHWRYVLVRGIFPPWLTVDPMRGLGLSQSQLHGYLMTALVFPAIAFLVARLWKTSLRPGSPALRKVMEPAYEPV